MKIISKAMTLATASTILFMAAPASAQVGGVATANSTVAIAQAKALAPAYQQIETTYKSYLDQIQTKRQEMQGMLAQLDKNGDKNVDQAEMDAAEAAKSPVLKQIEAKEKEIGNLQTPIAKAKMFVISQLIDKYGDAQQAVVTAKKLNYILAPDAFVWAPPAINVTPAITTELDKLLPTVNVTPAADWNPDRQTYEVYQQLQQLFSAAAARAAAEQQNGAAASGQQPVGR